MALVVGILRAIGIVLLYPVTLTSTINRDARVLQSHINGVDIMNSNINREITLISEITIPV